VDLDSTSTTASASGDGYVVNGVRNYVTTQRRLDYLRAAMTTRASLFAVRGDATGVARGAGHDGPNP